jgi:glycosyltransferase involved in cell wall biosynthesis
VPALAKMPAVQFLMISVRNAEESFWRLWVKQNEWIRRIMPRVSVCMATYNGSTYLREQLDSILSQLQTEDELIISDDHSTDETQVILGGYQDARIKIFTNPGERGHVQNFAFAMAQATGEFIALSDQDDIWVENRLDRMLEQLRKMPQYSLVVGDFTEFGSDQQRNHFGPLGPSPRSGLVALCRLFVGLAKYFGSAFMFRRDLVRFVLPIPEFIEAHDVWIAMNASVRGKITHLEETTVMRRVHGKNLTPEKRRGLLKVMRSRLSYLAGLLQACSR